MNEMPCGKILLTGATGNIGSAILKALAVPGRKIVIHYHLAHAKASALSREAKATGAQVQAISMDLTMPSKTAELVAAAADWLGGLDILIHLASAFEKTPFGHVTEGQWDRIISIDLKAAFFMAQQAAAEMKVAGGKMIFFSDVAAARPYPGYLPYSIAKAGLEALVRGLARALAPKIGVNAIAPYLVTRPAPMDDDEWAKLASKSPMRKPSSPDEISSIVKMLVESAQSLTGQVITVDGGRLLR